METRRLEVLWQLARLGSMREVADELGTTTSTVSQQVAALAREVGAPLVEPVGRRVRLTPAGRRLADHATTILAAVEAARLDLDPEAEPAGTLRVAGFASAIRRSLLPIVAELSATHPELSVVVHEHEPTEAFELLDRDAMDLVLTYDYSLAPGIDRPGTRAVPLWSTPWALGVPTDHGCPVEGDSLAVFSWFRDASWIANSRNTADEDVIRTIASMAGFAPRFSHQADSLDLVQDLIVGGLGIGLLPVDQPVRDGVELLALDEPAVVLRAYAVTRAGRAQWAPTRMVLERLVQAISRPGRLG